MRYYTSLLTACAAFFFLLSFSSFAIGADIVLDYDTAGQLVSIDYPGASNTIQYTYDLAGNITTIQRSSSGDPGIVDSDHDGMDDDWEMSNFGDLNTADQSSDYDGDGYSDLQEYLNWRANEKDPAGFLYDPKKPNAPGGTGYSEPEQNRSFWNIMLPAILNASGL